MVEAGIVGPGPVRTNMYIGRLHIHTHTHAHTDSFSLLDSLLDKSGWGLVPAKAHCRRRREALGVELCGGVGNYGSEGTGEGEDGGGRGTGSVERSRAAGI